MYGEILIKDIYVDDELNEYSETHSCMVIQGIPVINIERHEADKASSPCVNYWIEVFGTIIESDFPLEVGEEAYSPFVLYPSVMGDFRYFSYYIKGAVKVQS